MSVSKSSSQKSDAAILLSRLAERIYDNLHCISSVIYVIEHFLAGCSTTECINNEMQSIAAISFEISTHITDDMSVNLAIDRLA